LTSTQQPEKPALLQLTVSSPLVQHEMKHTLTILIMLITFTGLLGYGQIISKESIKPIIIKSGLMVLSGSFDATAEVVRINYDYFDVVFPNANEQFWDAKLSQGNKWKNGDYKQGEKFLFSSTVLVWTTDGYHLMRTLRNTTMITALVIPIGKKKNWKQYVAEGLIYYCSYTAGFSITYNLIYKMP